jgi:hypothetical protein
MVMIEVLEFGYSLESARYFVKFFIQGIENENKEKLIKVISNIPDGDLKRFKIEEDLGGLIVLEFFSKEEYPFNDEIPTDKEINSVEETVKGFLSQFS